MSASNPIFARVVRILSQSLGADEDDIAPRTRLREDLGAESIDFLDIVFRLEREFEIRVPRGELFPESIFGDNAELIRDGRISDEGVALLRARMPYADLTAVENDRCLAAVTDLFTVDLIARYVEWKLSQDNTDTHRATQTTVVL
jgi:acyl carrier protein